MASSRLTGFARVAGVFDFQVRSGVSTERNAIRVLQRMGFPAEIVCAALSLVGAAASARGEMPNG
jgi:DNA mismatch repair ATPase MutS